MKIKRLVAVIALALSTPVLAETLNNNSVLALTATGLGDEAIIAKIKNSDADFDLSTNQLIALRQKGVSSPVLAAMLETAQQKSQKLSMDSPDPMVPHAPGVYLLDDQAVPPKMKHIDPTVTNQSKTGGTWGYALTSGIASMSIKASIQNETAKNQTDEDQPVFYFFFDEQNQGSAWNAGTTATVTSPSEFTLIKMKSKNGHREVRVGSVNLGGAKSGVMDKDQIPFEAQLIRPGVYKVSPKYSLASGEYGFLYAITSNGPRGALSGRIFDFSVKNLSADKD
ncbi:MAG: hypothetical protein ABF461_03515 [Zymomonas mobilis subsp. pomaceae]|uniref:Secreted protein n=1 Tax=Zymomonas mobilis subsp. pomaceae (strain ATCC 29192 / DSM 22645 / JCM 10191 / CCUG 17912 / NBRC 13757 / NCIMB 11200 / NRRL B-4491 / Barker I) TaxID=579138 RepID=F8ETX6_ZYMMT|nr:hypothetical protein [Zymomonas mobilis]AEI38073.1 hypothetical protein Zymop_1178 [Zymomonas mobilis subsp. pomaceae ATCC 29192]MDX5949439.1 hypothetical protein [Zymomonas mobilis subsp. pomaceae]